MEILSDFLQSHDLERLKSAFNHLNKQRHHPEGLIQIEQALRQKTQITSFSNLEPIFNAVGTGMDLFKTLNYSTLICMYMHAYGANVAKYIHNLSKTYTSSIKLLEHTNLHLSYNLTDIERQLNESRETFILGDRFYPLFQQIRTQLTEINKYDKKKFNKTNPNIFQEVAPLMSPVQSTHMLVGVSDEKSLQPMAEALFHSGMQYAYVVYGNGIDEFTVSGINTYVKITPSGVSGLETLHPEQLGLSKWKAIHLQVDNNQQAYQQAQSALTGKLLGSKYEMLLLNVACAIHVHENFSEDLYDAFLKAQKLLSQNLENYFNPMTSHQSML